MSDSSASGRANAEQPALPEGLLQTLAQSLRKAPVLALTGAGISTASGIPDYRRRDGTRRAKAPMMYQEFLASPAARQRYWARSMLGWPALRTARPNAAHRALAGLQRHGYLSGLITQNVDDLHHQAGAAEVLELHGNLHVVRCLNCGHRLARERVQEALEWDNPWLLGEAVPLAPDGDALLPEALVAGFCLPRCPACDSEMLKPDVVFFGGNVARQTAERAMQLAEQASALLVVGSSLMALSAFRLCQAVAAAGRPVYAVNLGKTRADGLLHAKLQQPCEQLLPELARRVLPGSSSD